MRLLDTFLLVQIKFLESLKEVFVMRFLRALVLVLSVVSFYVRPVTAAPEEKVVVVQIVLPAKVEDRASQLRNEMAKACKVYVDLMKWLRDSDCGEEADHQETSFKAIFKIAKSSLDTLDAGIMIKDEYLIRLIRLLRSRIRLMEILRRAQELRLREAQRVY